VRPARLWAAQLIVFIVVFASPALAQTSWGNAGNAGHFPIFRSEACQEASSGDIRESRLLGEVPGRRA
jgi:hypothetical protein